MIRFSCELFSAVARLLGNGDVGHRRRPIVSGRNNFKGLADYDLFAADIRLQTERYEMVCHTGEPRRSTTRTPPDSASSCQSVFHDSKGKPFESGEYRFAKRRILVSPAFVTSARSLRKLSQCPVSHKGHRASSFCRRQTSERRSGLVAEMV